MVVKQDIRAADVRHETNGGGAIDAVVARRRLQIQSAFFRQTPLAAALLDRAGCIVAINDAWKAMPNATSATDPGTDYLNVFATAADGGSSDAVRILQGLRDVLDGRRPWVRALYSEYVGEREHWFELSIWRVQTTDFIGAGILHEDVTESHEAERRATALANADPLTGICNRRGLEQALSTLADFGDVGHHGVFAILDLDGFKAVNDRYGHELGDRVLVVVARRLQHSVRRTDTVARIGGDEFAILLAGGAEAARRLARLVELVTAPMHFNDIVIDLGASYGWVPVVSGELSLTRLYRAADRAMYRMKEVHREAVRQSG